MTTECCDETNPLSTLGLIPRPRPSVPNPSEPGIGESYHQDNFTANSMIINNKTLTLTNFPSDPSKVTVVIRQGLEQFSGIDFQVIGKTLSWNGLALEMLLQVGDFFVVRYNPSTT